MSAQIHICCSLKIASGFKIFKPEFYYLSVVLKLKVKLVRQSQILQGTITIYSSDTIVTQVLTPAILSLGTQLKAFSCLQNMSGQRLDKT